MLVSGAYAFVLFALILLQPDFGSAIVIGGIWFGMVMMSGISWKHVLVLLQASYFVWSGKPLLVNYNAYDSDPNIVAPNWSDPRFTVKKATGILDASNALLQTYLAEDFWGWIAKDPQPQNRETMVVTPGWDTDHLGRNATNQSRENGMYYIREWLLVLKNQPKNVVISGWNDFSEEEAIEPARAVTGPPWVDSWGTETPDWYVQITSGYAHLRTGLMAGAYYRDEDTPEVYQVVNGKLVYQSSMPHGHPLIYLPAGTLKKLLSKNKVQL